MSKIFKIVKAIVLVWLVSVPVLAWASRGYIYESAGSVTVTVGNDAPHPALKNDTVTSGVMIRTGDNSHAVLKFEDGQIVALQANSTFLVREYIYNPQQVEKSNIVFSMFKGGMRFITGQIGHLNPRAFRLATPSATIGIRGTDFLVVLASDNMYNNVLSGSISVTNEAGITVITAGNTTLTASPAMLPASISPAAVPADTFSEIAAIPVPAPLAGEIPAPVPLPSAAAPAPANDLLTGGVTDSTAGGTAAGGAAADTAVALVATSGVSGTAIAIGVGVAAGVAALVTSSTTHH